MGPEARVPVGPSRDAVSVSVSTSLRVSHLFSVSHVLVSLELSAAFAAPLRLSLLFLPLVSPSSLLPCVPPPRCPPFFASLPLPHLSPLPSLCVPPFRSFLHPPNSEPIICYILKCAQPTLADDFSIAYVLVIWALSRLNMQHHFFCQLAED